MSIQEIIRLVQLIQRTGLSRSTIYARVKSGELPAPVSLGGRAVGWLASDIDAWFEQRIPVSKRSGQGGEQ